MVTTVAVMTMGGFTEVHAQDGARGDVDDQLLACAEIGETAERMACFDEVVNDLKEGAESSNVADAPSTRERSASAKVAAGAATAPAPADTPSPPAPSAGRPTSESPDALPSAAAEAPAPALEDTAVEDFGLENQKSLSEATQRERDTVDVHATIVRSDKSGSFHFLVELDNGQIWEETDGSRRIGLPKVGMPVRVYEGRFGGYRMKIGDDNRIAWVRRLK
jgi:hypothetical protein